MSCGVSEGCLCSARRDKQLKIILKQHHTRAPEHQHGSDSVAGTRQQIITAVHDLECDIASMLYLVDLDYDSFVH